MPNRRSVITGIGLVSALGTSKDECFKAMLAGEIGVDKVSTFDTDKLECKVVGQAAEVKLNKIVPKSHRKSVKLMSRDIQMAVLAANDAMIDCGLNTRANNPDGPIDIEPTRSGVNIGAGSMCCDLEELSQAVKDSVTDGEFDLGKWGDGGMESLTPLWLLKYLPNMLSCHVSIIYDLQGPSNAVTCGESAGLMSIGEAVRHIDRDHADVILAGGAESKVNAMNIMKYCLNNMAATNYNDDPKGASRPFDSGSDGLVPAEGGAIIILEEYNAAKARDAKVYAEVTGFASSYNHGKRDGQLLIPADNASGTAIAIKKAMERAGITANDLDLIITNGNGINQYDKAEANAIVEALGSEAEKIDALATKSRFGSAGAGSSAIDTAIAALCIENSIIPQTLNCDNKMAECPLNLTTNGNIEKEINNVLVVSMSLGGQTAAAIISKVK